MALHKSGDEYGYRCGHLTVRFIEPQLGGAMTSIRTLHVEQCQIYHL